jgi:H/ACA ribonucleoprotein complex non-core subunit NAF1
MATFKAPQLLPQDLLLISELVDVPPQRHLLSVCSEENTEDDIASSSSDSEEEIEKDLTAALEDESDT